MLSYQLDVWSCLVTSSGKLAVSHHDNWVGSDGTAEMFGDKEDNFDSSCLTLGWYWSCVKLLTSHWPTVIAE